MIISIASGKGGTGKTTISTNLAYTLSQNGKKVVLADLDVEEANSALFLKPEWEESEPISAFIPKMNDKCTYCGKCAEVCEFNAIIVLKEVENIMVFDELCHSCFACKVACPYDAIDHGKKDLGTIDFGKSDGIDIYQGNLKIGEAMAVPLIKQTKRKIKYDNYDVVIYDAPPGTSCPVIEATKNADFVLLVTEPTPFGLHDLKLAIETMREIDKPFGIIINKANLGDRKVYEYCESEQISIIMELPQDERIAKIYAKGGLPARELPELQNIFKDMFIRIERRLQ